MPSLSDIQYRHARHYANELLRAQTLFVKQRHDVSLGLGVFDAERHNIESGHAWAVTHSPADPRARELCGIYPLAADVLKMRHHPILRSEWLEAGITATKQLEQPSRLVLHMGNLAITLADLGQYRKAVELYEEVLLYFRRFGDCRNEALALRNIAAYDRLLGDYRTAESRLSESLTIAQSLNDNDLEGAVINELGLLQAARNDPDSAIASFEKALAIFHLSGNRQFEGAVLSNLSAAAARRGDDARADDCRKASLAIARELIDRTAEAVALDAAASAIADQQDLAAAIEVAEQSLTVGSQAGDLPTLCCMTNNLARLYEQAGDLDRAEDFFGRAVHTSQVAGFKLGEATALENLGKVLKTRGHFRESICQLERAADAFSTLGDCRRKADVFALVAECYEAVGQLPLAKRVREQVVHLWEEAADHLNTGVALNFLATHHQRANEFEQHVTVQKRAIEYFRRASSRKGEMGAVHNLALAYLDAGHFADAERYFDEALHITREIADQHYESLTLLNLARLHKKKGELQQAADRYQLAATVARAAGSRLFEASALHEAAQLAAIAKDFGQAKRAYEAAATIYLEIGELESAADHLLNLATVRLVDGNFEQCLAPAFQARDLFLQQKKPRRAGHAYRVIGTAQHGTGQRSEAVSSFERGIESLRESGDAQGLAMILNSYGESCQSAEQFSDAIQLHVEALKIARDHKIESEVRNSLVNLAMAYGASSDRTRALSFAAQARVSLRGASESIVRQIEQTLGRLHL